jgi:hypothetical protein
MCGLGYTHLLSIRRMPTSAWIALLRQKKIQRFPRRKLHSFLISRE